MEFTLTGNVGGELRVWKIAEGENRVGRDPDVAISISDQEVSRKHAMVRRIGDAVYVEDTGSRNGTTVNGAAVTRPQRLQPLDRVGFASVILRFDGEGRPAEPSLSDHGQLTPMLTLHWSDVSAAPEKGAPASIVEALSEMGDFLSRRQSLDEVLELCLEWVERLLPSQRACLLLLNASGEPELRAARARRRQEDVKALAVSRTMVQAVIRDRSALLVRDAQADQRFKGTDSVVLSKIRSALVAPMFDNANVIGVLYVDTSDIVGAYGRDQLRQLALLANILAVKITNARLIEAERAQERLRQEMETAARIQRALLPGALFCPRGYEMEARVVPSSEVAGDLYDGLSLPDERVLFVVGDVSGHGVGPALIMANAIAAIRALAGLANDPVDLVSRIHRQMCRSTELSSFVTMFVGILDTKAGRLSYVNAGHEYPALISPGKPIERLASTSPPVGMFAEISFESAVVDFPPGALLGIWTDGISEAHVRKADTFDAPKLFADVEPIDALLARLYDLPLAGIANEVFSSLDRFLEGQRAPDDATLFLLRREGE